MLVVGDYGPLFSLADSNGHVSVSCNFENKWSSWCELGRGSEDNVQIVSSDE